MTDLNHLNDNIKPVMQWLDKDRVNYIKQDRWIKYDQASQIIDTLSDILTYPKSQRMPNLLLVGNPGNGKSTILQHFQSLHAGSVTIKGDPILPVLRIDMPSEPNETRFWSEILHTLKLAHRPSDRADSKKAQAESMMMYAKVRMLMVDEIHNMLHGTPRQQRQFMAVLKNLSNKLKIPIVLAGTREAILVMHTDTQLSSRFEVASLPIWELNRDFLRLLASFERILPLAKPSNLASKELAIKLHEMCSGSIGELSRILERAAISAINNGRERITLDELDSLNWVQLQEYRNLASGT